MAGLLLAVVAMVGGTNPALGANSTACTLNAPQTGSTTVSSETISADNAVRTVTGTMTVEQPSGDVTLDYTMSISYSSPDGILESHPILAVPTAPTKTTPQSGGIAVGTAQGTPQFSMEVTMSYSNLSPPDADVQLMVFGQEFSESDGESAFNDFSVSGDAGPVTLFDPASQLQVGGSGIAPRGQSLAAGQRFQQPSVLANSDIEWWAALPVGATSMKFAADPGLNFEGVSVTVGIDGGCSPIANTDTVTVTASQTQPATIDVVAGTAFDVFHDAANPLSTGGADSDDSDLSGATVEMLHPNKSNVVEKAIVYAEGVYTVVDGKVVFTPGPRRPAGPLSPVRYRLTDVDGLSTVGTIELTLELAPDNLPPTAQDDTATTDSGVPVNLSPYSNDSDSDGTIDPTSLRLVDPRSPNQRVTEVTLADEGTFVADTVTGDVTFTPSATFSGTTSIQYTVGDDQGAVSATATISIEVVAPTPEPLELRLIDPATGDTTLAPVVIDSEGTHSLDLETGAFSFEPDANFSGTSLIHFGMADGNGNVASPNERGYDVLKPPTVNDDSTNSAGQPVTLNPVANDHDADGTIVPTSVAFIDPATNSIAPQAVAIGGQGTFSVNDGLVTFRPESGFTGDSTVNYLVSDNDGNTSRLAAITVTVTSPTATYS